MSVMRRTAPSQEATGIPPGIPFIIGNEAAERFSYYGMRGILVIFMTKYLLDDSGALAPMSEADAMVWYHTFASAVYFLPIFGALLADTILGKYRTIMALSVVYCFGHLALALDETRTGLAIGLGLIAIGAGGIKPCVAAHLGDQFGKGNAHRMAEMFNWFYFAINMGGGLAMLATPWLLENYGPRVAFAVPGILMFIATVAFWLGRNRFVHVPPGGLTFLRETFSGEGIKTLARLSVIIAFSAIFSSLYEQSGSAWVLQAEKMDRTVLGFELMSAQIQGVNPFLVMLYIPLFTYALYPLLSRVFPLSPLRKIGIGLFLTVVPFLICAYVQMLIDAGGQPSIAWQILCFVILTAAEVFLSVTLIEFCYTQAPKTMKSSVMSLDLLAISLGNAFTALVNTVILRDDGTSMLEGPDYFLFFAGLMLVAALVYIPIARRYKVVNYVQDAA